MSNGTSRFGEGGGAALGLPFPAGFVWGGGGGSAEQSARCPLGLSCISPRGDAQLMVLAGATRDQPEQIPRPHGVKTWVLAASPWPCSTSRQDPVVPPWSELRRECCFGSIPGAMQSSGVHLNCENKKENQGDASNCPPSGLGFGCG